MDTQHLISKVEEAIRIMDGLKFEGLLQLDAANRLLSCLLELNNGLHKDVGVAGVGGIAVLEESSPPNCS